MRSKYCKYCEKEKPVSEFHRDRHHFSSRCKGCSKAYQRQYYRNNRKDVLAKQSARVIAPETKRGYQLRYLYGMSPEEYQSFLNFQGGTCAVCHEVPDHRLSVDHDHKTGKVRGLLCKPCNLAIGALGDSYEGVMRAANYLLEAGGHNAQGSSVSDLQLPVRDRAA